MQLPQIISDDNINLKGYSACCNSSLKLGGIVVKYYICATCSKPCAKIDQMAPLVGLEPTT